MYLLPIHDVPFLGLAVTVHNIACMEIPLLIPGLLIRFLVIEITTYDCGTTDAQLAPHVVVSNIPPFVVDKPIPHSSATRTIEPDNSNPSRNCERAMERETHLTSVFGINVFPTLPVSSLSG